MPEEKKMNAEEALRRGKEVLEEWKNEKEKRYIELKGMLKGIQMVELSPTDKRFIRLLEVLLKGFNNIQDALAFGFELHISAIELTNNHQKRIEELETNILQLRETIDKLFHAR